MKTLGVDPEINNIQKSEINWKRERGLVAEELKWNKKGGFTAQLREGLNFIVQTILSADLVGEQLDLSLAGVNWEMAYFLRFCTKLNIIVPCHPSIMPLCTSQVTWNLSVQFTAHKYLQQFAQNCQTGKQPRYPSRKYHLVIEKKWTTICVCGYKTCIILNI